MIRIKKRNRVRTVHYSAEEDIGFEGYTELPLSEIASGKSLLVRKVWIQNSTVEELSNFVELSLKTEPVNEVGGFFLGRVVKKDGHFWLMIDRFEANMRPHISEPGRLMFSPEFLTHIDNLLESNSQELLGWIHTHPGHTAYLSNMDVNLQNTIFPLAHQVALVIDCLTEKWEYALLGRNVDNAVETKPIRKHYWKDILSHLS